MFQDKTWIKMPKWTILEVSFLWKPVFLFSVLILSRWKFDVIIDDPYLKKVEGLNVLEFELIILYPSLYRAKQFQVLFQSFPQVIIGVFIMQCLQMNEAGIIISFFLSLTSLLYGGGCLPALLYHEQEVEGLKAFWALFINSIDTLLRLVWPQLRSWLYS